jgi:hypothetical protein
VRSLSDVYPGSSHVSLVELDRASDAEVFDYALDKGYALVSKNVDQARQLHHLGDRRHIESTPGGGCSPRERSGGQGTRARAVRTRLRTTFSDSAEEKLRETVHGDFVPSDEALRLLYGLVEQLEIPEE